MNVDSHILETEAMDTRDDASETPPQISPVNSPQKSKNQPSDEEETKSDIKPENKPPPEEPEEIRVKLCAKNKKKAMFHPALNYMGEKGKNHFVFSTYFPPSQIDKVKKDLFKVMKPPNDVHIVDY